MDFPTSSASHDDDDGSDNSDNTSNTASSSPKEFDRPQVKALKRLSENYESIFESQNFHNFYSDATIVFNESREIPVHRCILSARSPFFANLFFSASEEKRDGKLELKELVKDLDVGFESLAAVLSYLYGGKVKPLPEGVCVCVDESCSHVGCRPIVDYLVEVLYVSFTFRVSELFSLYQRHLLDILDKVATDDILAILSVATKCDKSCEKLLTKCIKIIIKSDIEATTLEKTLPPDTVKEIMDSRIARGLGGADSYYPDRHVKRILRALDSDDMELVIMLLQERKTNINDACALHYAVAHCDARTVTKLLDIEHVDVNHMNSRGYTVLHVAAMRREPEIIMALITKGACPFDLTSDGRKALQISKRLTRSVDYSRSTAQGETSSKDKLCIGILEQAERKGPPLGVASFCCTSTGNDILEKLLYLENRVGLATLLFPGEAKVARFTAQVDCTREFLPMTNSRHLPSSLRTRLNFTMAPFRIDHEHLMRLTALSRTVELAKLFFPCCFEAIGRIVDSEDLSELACREDDNAEQRLKKKQRYTEIQEMLAEAFNKDTIELEKSTSITATPVRAVRSRRLSQLTAKN